MFKPFQYKIIMQEMIDIVLSLTQIETIVQIPNLHIIIPGLFIFLGYVIIYYLTKTEYGGLLGKEPALDMELRTNYDRIVGPILVSIPVAFASLLMGFMLTLNVIIVLGLFGTIQKIPELTSITFPLNSILYYSCVAVTLLVTIKYLLDKTRENNRILNNSWKLPLHSIIVTFYEAIIGLEIVFLYVLFHSFFTQINVLNMAKGLIVIQLIFIFMLIALKSVYKIKFLPKLEKNQMKTIKKKTTKNKKNTRKRKT